MASFHRRRRGDRPVGAGLAVGGIVAGTLTDRLVRRNPRWQMGVPIVGMGIALPAGLAYSRWRRAPRPGRCWR
jgi:hypothetical protein